MRRVLDANILYVGASPFPCYYQIKGGSVLPVALVDWTLEMQVIHLTTVLESLDYESWYLKN